MWQQCKEASVIMSYLEASHFFESGHALFSKKKTVDLSAFNNKREVKSIARWNRALATYQLRGDRRSMMAFLSGTLPTRPFSSS
jgi:hypothetical protein